METETPEIPPPPVVQKKVANSAPCLTFFRFFLCFVRAHAWACPLALYIPQTTMPPPRAAARAASSNRPEKASKKAGSKKAQEPAAPKSAGVADSADHAEADDKIAKHVSAAQATKAFNALLSYQLKKMNEDDGPQDLLAGGPQSAEELQDGDVSDRSLSVFVNVTLKEGGAPKRLKPHRIPLAHPLTGSGSGARSVCLITPDPQRWWKDALVERDVKSVNRVVGVAKLAGKFKAFDARRQLMNDHDLFLADDRLVPILPRLLGSKFFESKKQPLLVNLRNPEQIKTEIEAAVNSTSFVPTRGTNASVRIGHLRAHTPQQLTENLGVALPAVVEHLHGGWSNVQALDVKLAQSAALPVWNCFLGHPPASGKTKKSKADDEETEVVEDVWRWNLNGAELEKARAEGAARAAEWADQQATALVAAAEEVDNPDVPAETLATNKRKRVPESDSKETKKSSKKNKNESKAEGDQKEGDKANSKEGEPENSPNVDSTSESDTTTAAEPANAGHVEGDGDKMAPGTTPAEATTTADQKAKKKGAPASDASPSAAPSHKKKSGKKSAQGQKADNKADKKAVSPSTKESTAPPADKAPQAPAQGKRSRKSKQA